MSLTLPNRLPSRRLFLQSSLALSASALLPHSAFSISSSPDTPDPDLNIIGPRSGYSPQIGTLVSQLTWMRYHVLQSVQGMSQKDLDFLLDDKANRIGALLLHLVAAERLYQANTFDNIPVQKLSDEWKAKWEVPADLGAPARQTIVGHDLDYYLNLLHETREISLAELKKRNDTWLMAVDKTWGGGPMNNYCKWFHVCEHESHHNGQILLLKNRLPGAKPPAE